MPDNWNVHLIFPKSCIICRKYGTLLCANCTRRFANTLPECIYCRRISNKGISHKNCLNILKEGEGKICRCTILWLYDIYSKQLIHQYKYLGVTLLKDNLRELILETLRWINYKSDAKSIIPAPLHWSKELTRGFNQVDIITNAISEYLGGIEIIHAIERTKRGEVQAQHNREERLADMENYYQVTTSIQGKVILVDDVVTTGKTLSEIATTIQAGAPNIEVEGFALYRANYRGADNSAPPSKSINKDKSDYSTTSAS